MCSNPTGSLPDPRSRSSAKYTSPPGGAATIGDLEGALPALSCTGKPGQAPDVITKWRLFSPAAYMQAPSWDLPWGWATIVLALVTWATVEFVFAFMTVAATLVLLFKDDSHSAAGQAGSPVQATAIALCFQVGPAPPCLPALISIDQPAPGTSADSLIGAPYALVFAVAPLKASGISDCILECEAPCKWASADALANTFR